MIRIHGSSGRTPARQELRELTERIRFQDPMPRRSTNSVWYTGGILYRQCRLTGYASPEIIATLLTDQKVRACQAFSWNPSITGAKAEEAFALTGPGPEMTTRLPGGGG